MKAVKKVIAVAAGGAGLGAGTAFANYPVIDVSVLTETIEQVYQQYMSIQQAIQSVQNQYVQIKHAIEAVKNINWQKFADLASPDAWQNPETLRNAYKASLEQYNSYMNKIRNVKQKFEGKHVKIGNMKLSYADLLGVGGEDNENANGVAAVGAMADTFNERRKKVADAWAGQRLTARIFSKGSAS